MAFTEQSVDLQGQLDRESGDNPTPVGITTVPGWNFVGVVDQDGDQTEDNFGDTLQDSEDADVNADDYMPGFRQAYTWDAIANGYRVLDGGDKPWSSARHLGLLPRRRHRRPVRRLKTATLASLPSNGREATRETPPWKHGGVFCVN